MRSGTGQTTALIKLRGGSTSRTGIHPCPGQQSFSQALAGSVPQIGTTCNTKIARAPKTTPETTQTVVDGPCFRLSSMATQFKILGPGYSPTGCLVGPFPTWHSCYYRVTDPGRRP